ncbi:MAG: hypothetical protein J6Y78_00910, partial [Paludibacteraceae bacterium]|nr:hypothetical protein [Paludibacteraceae bacterium]
SDCEEVIRAFFRPPFEGEKCRALSAAEVMQMMRVRGFYGKGYGTTEVWRSLKRLGFLPHMIRGINKYLIVEKDVDTLKTEGASDALTILHDSQPISDNEEVEPF